MNIAIYTRKSVYSDKSDSTESQANICNEYAKSNYEVTTVTKYEDEGFTGSNINRPGFSALMKDILNKKIDVLICYKIDRISRNVLDFSKTFDLLQAHNVEFVSVKEQIDTSTPLGRAMMYICSVFAQMERETIAERVKDSMIELAKSGKWTGGKAPIGYMRERTLINGKIHTVLVENKEELPFLNMIYDTFLGGYSLGGLETYFRKKEVRTLNGNYLSASQLHQILTTPHYVAATAELYEYFERKGCIMTSEKEKFTGEYGVLIYGRTSGGKKKVHTMNAPDKWMVSVGLHKPIISDKKWLSVQDRFGKNVIDKTRKHEIGILKGIVKCKCGYTLRVQHKVDKIYNKVYDNYFCQNRNRRGIEYCDMKMISVVELDNQILETLKSISINKNLLAGFLKKDAAFIRTRDNSTIQKEIRSSEKRIGNLTAALQDNMNSSASKYIIADIEKLDKQILGLNYELRENDIQERENRDKKDDIDAIYALISAYIKNFDSLNYTEKTSMLQKIIKECIWEDNKLIIRF